MTKMETTPAVDEVLVNSQEEALSAPAWGLAKTISILFSPPLLGTLGLFLVADKIGGRNVWLWAAVYGFACIALPIAYLIRLIRAGEVSDFHIRNRLERIKPMKAVLLLFSFTTLIFLAASAPYIFQVFGLVGALQTSVMLLITYRWKISGHGAGIAGFVALLLGLYGTKAAPALLIIPIVLWARVYLDRHDLAQTLAGALVGFSFMVMVFALVASHCPGAGLVCI
jgi:MFS family permease